MIEIDAAEVKAKLDRGEKVHLVDVRESAELAICRIEGSEHVPMLDLFLGLRAPAAGAQDEIVVLCHHGMRSFEAASFLRGKGFPRARSMAGGIDAWAARIDPKLKRY